MSRAGPLLTVWLCLWAACEAPAAPSISRADVYARATNHFLTADYFRPSSSTAEEPIHNFAPLLLQEISNTAPAHATLARFGALTSTPHNLSVDSSKPTIYAAAGQTTLRGHSYATFSYFWFYAPGPEISKRILCQGVRLTLDSTGAPVVWEILDDESGWELIFVSRKVESMAVADFGPPLPGRHFSVESATNNAPKVIVGRIIEDGPVPMGPMIYLDANASSVVTLACRCMPSQAQRLGETREYELVTISRENAAGVLGLARSGLARRPCFWPGDEPSEKRIESCLRLPGRL